jgi:26S proteasome regulatory subunit (ATPase 3-interacting protein)
LKAGKAKKVTREMREEVEKEWKMWARVSRRRERVARECWRWIEDVPGMQEKEKREELRESLGLDE